MGRYTIQIPVLGGQKKRLSAGAQRSPLHVLSPLEPARSTAIASWYIQHAFAEQAVLSDEDRRYQWDGVSINSPSMSCRRSSSQS